MNSQTPASRKGVQQLIGRLAALRRFITRFTDRLKPFFSTLKGAQHVGWNQECDQTLTTIKQCLTEPPILTSREVGDTLYLYLAVLEISVSATLFKEDENRKQRPIFFVSKSLSEAENIYAHLELAALALQVAAKKLRLYFQSHPIIVLINLPLRSIINKPDMSGWMVRWEIKVREFGIQYKPHLALKGQVLADFLT